MKPERSGRSIFNSPSVFLILALVSAVAIVYLVILGMAPPVRPLDWTGSLIYGPGPGFFWLILAWCVAVILKVVGRLVVRANFPAGKFFARAAWMVLLFLLAVESAILVDFFS